MGKEEEEEEEISSVLFFDRHIYRERGVGLA